MARSSAETPEAYLAELSPERREAISAVRSVILDNLPEGFEEGMQYGMISYHVPLDLHPDTHDGRPLGVAALASQKNYMSLYLLVVMDDQETERGFKERFAASGKKLDMGKCCVRFNKLDDLPLEVVAGAISSVSTEDLIGYHEAAHGP